MNTLSHKHTEKRGFQAKRGGTLLHKSYGISAILFMNDLRIKFMKANLLI